MYDQFSLLPCGLCYPKTIRNIPILPFLSGTFASKSYGPSLFCMYGTHKDGHTLDLLITRSSENPLHRKHKVDHLMPVCYILNLWLNNSWLKEKIQSSHNKKKNEQIKKVLLQRGLITLDCLDLSESILWHSHNDTCTNDLWMFTLFKYSRQSNRFDEFIWKQLEWCIPTLDFDLIKLKLGFVISLFVSSDYKHNSSCYRNEQSTMG